MAKKAKKAKKKPPKRWPAIRAAILSAVIVFNVLSAIPSPGHVSRQILQRKTNQTELVRWVKILDGFGIETNKDDLAAWYIQFARDFESVKRTLTAPVSKWMQYTMTTQGWRLFGMPDERPYALKIAVRRGDHTEVLYQSGHPTYRWEASFFQFRRVRGLYNPGTNPTATYNGFTKAVARKVFDTFPDADETIVSVLRTHTTLPGERPDPSVEERFEKRIRRPK